MERKLTYRVRVWLNRPDRDDKAEIVECNSWGVYDGRLSLDDKDPTDPDGWQYPKVAYAPGSWVKAEIETIITQVTSEQIVLGKLRE